MKKLFITAILASAISLGFAQNKGGISTALIQKIQSEVKQDTDFKARMNALSNEGMKDLSKSVANKPYVDTYFSDRVKSKGVTDQKSSGRCWLFTGLNVLRPKVIEKYNLRAFQLSHNYNFFWDQFEKSNLFLEGMIETATMPMDDKKVEWLFKNTINDGGQWTGVVDIIEKYGVVPKEIMPETFASENTGMMSKMIRRKLKEDGLKLRAMTAAGKKETDLRKAKEEMLTDIYRILAVNLGVPPANFDYRYEDADGKVSEWKNYTPKSFYKEFVGVNLNDYVAFMNDPSRAFGQVYEIEYDRHTFDGHNWKYINLEADKIKEFAVASIKANEAMYFSCDVGKQLDSDAGYLDVNNYDYNSLLGVDFTMDKKERIITFESGSSHGMTLVAVDLNKKGKPTKWLLENSWGQKGFKGHLIMTDEWFNEYMFRLVVNKKFVSPEVLKLLEKKAIMLPPWDPMFANEE
ncbi:MAG: C1 family peptidase [Bacteroidales bacterium]|nr:C1 family peptidase [Bacteroidales bacterium]